MVKELVESVNIIDGLWDWWMEFVFLIVFFWLKKIILGD